MRENRFNRNPQVNGNLRGVLSLSCFFLSSYASKGFTQFSSSSLHPPQTTWHSCHVFLFFMSFAEWFYCKCRTWNGTWVCELYGAKPLFRKHCKAVLCPIPVTMSVLLYFQSAEIFHWLLLSTISCRNIAIIYVLMNSLPFCIGYTWTEATVLYLKT